MKKKMISLAIVLLMLMTLFPTAYADNSTVTLTADDVKMKGGTITAYLGSAAPLNSIFNIIIPETIGGVTVTKIGSGAFAQKNITGVTIPDTVTYIGGAAFEDNGLTSLTLPYGLTYIGQHAFRFNLLKSITIPETVTYIGLHAFDYNNSTFTTFKLPNTGKWRVDDSDYCYDLFGGETVTIYHSYASEHYIDPKNPEGSLCGDFTYRKLSDTTVSIWRYTPDVNTYKNENVSIPETLDGYKVTGIDKSAFAPYSGWDQTYKLIKSITIPEGVTDIGDFAFAGVTDEASIAEGRLLENVNIPDSVTRIGKYAFAECPLLTNITIPEGVTLINDYTFECCSSLTSVSVPSGVTGISQCAFYNCTSLTMIELPSSLKWMDTWAFMSCTNLKDVYYTGSQAQWDAMGIDKYYKELPNATIHFNSTAPIIQNTTLTAIPTSSKVTVNGTVTAFDAYTINGNNYFKLRDLAKVISGTDKQFEVTWDGTKNAINLISGKSYTEVGGELAAGDGSIKTPVPCTSKIYVDGTEVALTAYTIGGNNFFKLRDVMQKFNVGVGWDGATSTITIDTSVGYTQ